MKRLGFIATLIPLLMAFQPVDLNQATKEQIMALPGIGTKLATRLLQYRTDHGKFHSPEDLLQVEGFKPGLLAKISDKIIFASPRRVIQKAKPLPEEPKISVEILPEEPSIQAVQEQAVLYAHLNPKQIVEWHSRARNAAWLPRLSSHLRRDLDNGKSVREKVGDPSIIAQRDRADWQFGVKAEWKLSDLIFSREELGVAREGFRQAILRERVLREVTKAYFLRRKLQISAQYSPPSDARQKSELDTAIVEYSAIIDSLTGGWFSKQLADV